MHFLVKLSGKSGFVAAIAPVNESVWEHLKMVLVPVILWWHIFFLLRGKKQELDPNRWFTGALVALGSALLTIPLLYYFYTQAFGVEFVVVDVLILLAAVTVGQLLGMSVYRNTNGIPWVISLVIMIGILAGFALFTFYPPHIPLFKDSSTGKFGIG